MGVSQSALVAPGKHYSTLMATQGVGTCWSQSHSFGTGGTCIPEGLQLKEPWQPKFASPSWALQWVGTAGCQIFTFLAMEISISK